MSELWGLLAAEVQHKANVVTAAIRDVETSQSALCRSREVARQLREAVLAMSGIAQQTHLLALNASIAAAKPGDLGPRISAVAGDIQALAKRMAKVAEETQVLIASLMDATTEAVPALNGVNSKLQRLHELTEIAGESQAA